jgi:hypothetical protein
MHPDYGTGVAVIEEPYLGEPNKMGIAPVAVHLKPDVAHTFD